MPAVPRKKSVSKRKGRNRPGNFFVKLLLLIVVVALGWFWWHHHYHHLSQSSPPKKIRPAVPPEKVPARPKSPAPVPIPAPPATIPKPPVPTPEPPPATNPPKTNAVIFPPAVTPLPAPAPPPIEGSRPVRNTLEMQIALARRVISPGVIDANMGSQTRAALLAFQRSQHLPASGLLDAGTRSRLLLDAPIFRNYTVTADDLASLQPIGQTWLEKSEQTALAYETELELVAEKGHANPKLIKELNPGVDWENISAGTVLKIPAADYPPPDDKAAFVVIHLSQKNLEAFDAQTNLLAHFPCSIAEKVEKRPVGELHVIVIAPNPNYTVNPKLFSESAELRRIGHKLILPPGPNNPVGVAWIGLDRPGYGMHGTPVPELVGRTESHGCFRLANWDATYLMKLVWIGMPVEVKP